ncbi:transcription factor Adf-1-like [Cyprinodon tularosa]|uniref:transcription factor Adf-1-like n=1 Tax=Cyprinodon tularosa TaxID=77115 RepID=UPI0018E21DD2|nr:transcription factor Adf-1-like [Cyprinodon tularosa]
MDLLEELICEEVRKHPHLYDSRSIHYKDSRYSRNSWREIAMNVGVDSAEAVRKWKNARDKFVRQRRDMRAKKRGDPGGKKVPAFYITMSWLEPFVKHRKTTSNFPSETQMTQDPDPTCGLSSDTTAELSSNPPSPTRTLESLCASQTKHQHTDEQGVQARLEQLTERRQMLQQGLQQDDCSSFGVFIADLLRKVPVDSRDIVTRSVINHMYDQMDRVRAAAQTPN